MLIRCELALKERIFSNVSNLKDKKNEDNKPFFINKQLPEQIAKQKRRIREQISKHKKKDRELPTNEKAKIQVLQNTVYIDGDPVEDFLKQVEVNECFPDKTESERLSKIKLSTSDVQTEKESTFAAFAVKVNQMPEVRKVYRKVKILHPGADHIIAAYRIKQHTGYQDDGEHAAGHKLLEYISREHPMYKNFAVYVV